MVLWKAGQWSTKKEDKPSSARLIKISQFCFHSGILFYPQPPTKKKKEKEKILIAKVFQMSAAVDQSA